MSTPFTLAVSAEMIHRDLPVTDRIRRLPFGTGIVLLRSAPPIVTDLHPWPKRADAAQLKADRAEIETLLQLPES